VFTKLILKPLFYFNPGIVLHLVSKKMMSSIVYPLYNRNVLKAHVVREIRFALLVSLLSGVAQVELMVFTGLSRSAGQTVHALRQCVCPPI